MTSIIRVLGVSTLAMGVVLLFGAYQIIVGLELATKTQALIPILHLFAGIGLIRLKNWGRDAALFLTSLYLFLGMLVLLGDLTVIHFVPIIPIFEYIPTAIFQLDVHLVSFVTLVVVPIAVFVFLSMRSTARIFDSALGGHFAWGAPFLVVLASIYLFSYPFLSSAALMLTDVTEGLLVAGHTPTELGIAVFGAFEFVLPVLLAIGLRTGGRVMWFFTLAVCIYYGISVFWSRAPGESLFALQTLFFKGGWLFVFLVLLVHWWFFWHHLEWSRRRALRYESPIYVERWWELHILKRVPWLYPAFVFFLAACVLGGTGYLHFWKKAKLKEVRELSEIPEPAPVLPKLGGTFSGDVTVSAIVGGQVVEVGSEVAGYRVAVIEPERVQLIRGDEMVWIEKEAS